MHGRAFTADAGAWDKAVQKLRASLDRHWCEQHQVYTAMWPAKGKHADDLIDAVQLLAVLDADLGAYELTASSNTERVFP